MFIHEAIKATTQDKPFVRRRAWAYVTLKPTGAVVKLQPTNSPDGCLIHSPSRENPYCGWQPTAGDLIADDWEPVDL